MNAFDSNLLTQLLIDTRPLGPLTLPGFLAALSRDAIDGVPACRPHQGGPLHMFCVQLGGLALHGEGREDIPTDENIWRDILRRLTPDCPDDEPWRLVVDDWTKPAFLQPPVPAGVALKNDVPTPDALDLLITSRNHDLKQSIAKEGAAQDWIFALISLQTGEGYGGRDNQGIARMNGGWSSRPMLTLVPTPARHDQAPRPGAWFRRDLSILLTSPKARDHAAFRETDGLGLTWLADWPERAQLLADQLDPWFIEVCRRVRLQQIHGRLSAVKGMSEATRIDAKAFKGVLGDPWAPVHKTRSESFTLGEKGDFGFATVVELVFSGGYELPLLAKPTRAETEDTPQTLVLQALARGNSKTGGFRSRLVPLSRGASRAMASLDGLLTMHAAAVELINEIKVFDKALNYALVLAIAKGEAQSINRKKFNAHAQAPRDALDRFADAIFFMHLWRRHAAADEDARAAERKAFLRALWGKTKTIFEGALPTMPCGSLIRPKAENNARGALFGMVMKSFRSDLIDERSDADAA
ncbi:MAG: hypothetical protein NT037_16100 [Hyphomicrobiales bacterium]|jgi:CRISPR system Cascade subunit CasA|nr:hypothetical protein [Hyphomicrobiales bacterium]